MGFTNEHNRETHLGARDVIEVLSSEYLSSGLVHESVAKSTSVWQMAHGPCKSLLLLTRFLETLLSSSLFTAPAFHWHFSRHAFSVEPQPLFYL